MNLKKTLHFLYRSCFWLFGLSMLLFTTVAVYLLLMSHNTCSFLPPDATVLIQGKSIENTPLKKWNRIYPGFTDTYPEAASLIRQFATIRKQLPELFKRINPVMTSPFTLCVGKAQNTLLTIDLGWKSVLFSASSFIVRSAFSPDKKVRYSSKEFYISGKNRTLYTIRLLRRKESITLALKRNLLFISLSEDTLKNAFKTGASDASLSRDRSLKRARDCTDSRGDTICLQGEIPWFLKRSLLLPFPYLRWICLTGSSRKKGINGCLTFSEDLQKKQPVLHRLLHSNRFIPGKLASSPGENGSIIKIILFDDLSEILKLKKLRKLPYKITRLSANEAGLIQNRNGWTVYLRLLSTGAGKAIARKLAAAAPGKQLFSGSKSSALAPLTALFRMPPPRFTGIRDNLLLCSNSRREFNIAYPEGRAFLRQLIRKELLPANTLLIKPHGKMREVTTFSFAEGLVRFRSFLIPIHKAQ